MNPEKKAMRFSLVAIALIVGFIIVNMIGSLAYADLGGAQGNQAVNASTIASATTITMTPASGSNISLATAGAGLVTTGTDYQAAQAMTAGTMTQTNSSLLRSQINRYDWTNAMVVAISGTTAGDITVCTLPANTAVTNCFVVIDTPDTSTNALTVACGRTSAAYTDFVAAKDAKATAGTIYGSAAADRGTNVGWDLVTVSGTTAVKCHFIKTTTNLSTCVGCTGHVYLETITLP